MNYVEGASMLVSRSFLDEIGLMCEDYFLYFEEADWATRAKDRFNLGYAPKSIVYHKVGACVGTSSNPLKKSYTCDYFNIRNRLLFTRRFYPAALPTVWLVISGALALRLVMGKWDRVVMIFRLLFNIRNGQSDMLPEYQAKS
jgi:GT2 family glycosyltransferase